MVRRFMVVVLVTGFSGSMALGQLRFFDDRDEFHAWNLGTGKLLKGVEDFEENTLPPSSVIAVPSPLESGVPNTNFPAGLTGLNNLSISTNTGRPLALLTVGFLGLVSDLLGANFFADATFLTFTDDNKTAVGFDLVDPIFGPQLAGIDIYDTSGNLIGSTTAPTPGAGAGGAFFGVWSAIPIGRIEVDGQNGGAELLDNIECWFPGEPECEPCDTDCNDVINAFDIEPFLDLIFDENVDPCCGERGVPGSSGDTNGDGLINSFDIEGFLDCLFP